MVSYSAILVKKAALEAQFVERNDTGAQSDYLSLLSKLNRSFCGIMDFRWPGVPTPLYMRCGSSDFSNFLQMFVNHEYGFQLNTAPARILDLGAYAGYAAIYLAGRFPYAEIVAVEPSPRNFQMLALNTGAYSRIRRLNVAVWGHNSSLEVTSTTGGDWGIQLGQCDGVGPSIPALSIPEILSRVGWDAVDYLKCDIEGAEVSVFSECGGLIARMVQWCTVETHDAIAPGSSKVVKEAFPEADFVNSRSGEFEVFSRRAAGQDSRIARLSLLLPETGVRPISLQNVRTEGWAYYMFDDSCQLHPAENTDPPAQLTTTIPLSGHSAFECEVSVANELGYSVDFLVQITNSATGLAAAQSRLTVAAGERQRWVVPLAAPGFGNHDVSLQTVMSMNSPTNHQAFANWISPSFRG